MTYKIKGTTKQKKAINFIVAGDNLGSAMIKAGYSEKTAHCPVKLTESKGFREICEKVGLTETMVIQALADDIRLKPQDRSREIAQAAKILGLYKADNEQQRESIDLTNAEFIEIIRAYKKHV